MTLAQSAASPQAAPAPVAASGEPADPSPPRIGWIDVARGVTICTVVFHHVIQGLENAHVAGPTLTFWHLALNPPMLSLFILLSAFFAKRVVEGPPGPFWRRVAMFLWLYLLWTLIEFGSHLVFAGQTNNAVDWRELLVIGWKPFFGNWFVYALAIFLVASRLLRGVDYRLRLGLGLILYFTGFWISSEGNTSLLHDLMQLYIYFEAGLALRRPISRLAEATPLWAVVALSVAYVLTYLYAWPRGLVVTPVFYTLLVALSLPTLLMWSVQLSKTRLEPLFSLLGRRSLEIYLIHFLPAGATHVIARKLHMDAHPIVVAFVGTGVAIAFALVVAAVLERLRLGFFFRLPGEPRRGAPPPRAAEAAA